MSTPLEPQSVAAPRENVLPLNDAAVHRRKSAGLFRIREDIPSIAYVGIAVLSFVIPLVAWCAASYSGKVTPLALPTPTSVLQALSDGIHDGSLWPNIEISVFRIGMGFLISALLAIPIGILMGSYKAIEAAHEPLVGFIRYVPVPALIPLVMVMVGLGEPAKILLIFLGTYFQMVIVAADVTRQVPRGLLNAARTLGASRTQVLFNVLLPATLPGLVETCRTMIGWAWTYLVIAEVVATDSGLGYSIMKAQRFMRTDQIYMGIVVLGLLGLGTDMLFKILTPRLLPWAEAQKG